MNRFKFRVNTGSDVGCRRKNNEDRIFYVCPSDVNILNQKGLLAIVADGMGGHQAGEIASQMAVDEISKCYYQERLSVDVALKNAFHTANQTIHSASLTRSDLAGMGTTGTGLAIIGNRLWSAHVGDSRLYRVRKGKIELLTEDHTLVREWVVAGLINEEEARRHPRKNIITRSLGTRPTVDVDINGPLEVEANDRYILCSDGLYDLVNDEEIERAATGLSIEQIPEQLIALAKDRGGFDNISVIVVGCEE